MIVDRKTPELLKSKEHVKRSLIKSRQPTAVSIQSPVALNQQLNSTTNPQQQAENEAKELREICKTAPDSRTKLQLITGFLSKTQTSGTFNYELLPVIIEFTNKSIYSFPDQDFLLFVIVLERSGLKHKLRPHRPLVNILMKYASRVYKRWNKDMAAKFIRVTIQLLGNYHYYYPSTQVMFMDLLEKYLSAFDDNELMSTVYLLASYAIVTWKDLSPAIQTSISNFIIRYHNQSEFDAKVANSFLYAFAKMSPAITNSPADLHIAILAIATKIITATLQPNVDTQLRSPQLLSNTLSALSLLGFSAAQEEKDVDPGRKVPLPQELQLLIFESLAINFVTAKEKEASNIFDSLGNLGFAWYKLSPQLQNTLLTATIKRREELPLIGILMILRGFSRMQITWMNLPKLFRDFISDAIIRVTKNIDSINESISISLLLRHFVDLNVKFMKVRPDLQLSLFAAIRQSLPHLTGIEYFSGIINSLSYMDLPFLEIEQHIGEDLLVFAEKLVQQPVNVTFSSPNAQLFCQIIPSLGSTNTKWALFEPRWKAALSNLLSLDPQPSKFTVTTLLTTLSQLGVKWLDFPRRLRSYWQIHLTQASWLDLQGLNLVVSGLGMLDARWTELEIPVRQKFVEVLTQLPIVHSNINQLKRVESIKALGMILYSLSQLRAHWEDLPKDAIQQHYLACEGTSIAPHEFQPFIYGIAHLNAKWDGLSKEIKGTIESHLQQKLASYLNADLAQVAYALATLTCESPLELLDQKSRGRKSNKLLEMEQIQRIATLLCSQLKRRLQDGSVFDAESALQIEIFFEYISMFSWGRALVADLVASQLDDDAGEEVDKKKLFPIMSSESVSHSPKPSILSIKIAEGMAAVFSQQSQEQQQQPLPYQLKLQYHRPGHVFRSSIAILDTSTQQPVALIDVSIPECVLFSGKRIATQKQILKERISRHYYPTAAFIRLSVEDIEKYGQLELGRRIAEKICKGELRVSNAIS